jgi:hypothetical protein
VDCEDVALDDVFSGSDGIFPPSPYEEESLANEDSQILTGADDGLDEDRLTVNVLLLVDDGESIVDFLSGSRTRWVKRLDFSERKTRLRWVLIEESYTYCRSFRIHQLL